MTDLRSGARRAALLSLLALSAAAAGLSAQTRLELGKMWTFENPPLAYLEEEYGFAPNQEWLDSLRLASLRFGSWCSASFVSPQGLIMTNHHCVRGVVGEAQPPDQDWVADGFYASSLEDEAKLDMTVQQLVSMTDVTARMLEGITADDDDATAEEKRQANEERILETAREEHPDLDPQVVTLHNGAQYQLYSYKVWSDIRLVCAPHLQSAHFGGDPDNFTYPRYSLDFAFCRAYENGEPADTAAHYFRWSNDGAQEGELVFVTGNPGSTGRLLTHAQMVYQRDTEQPMFLQMISNRLARLKFFAEQIPQFAKQLRTQILSDENAQKALTGYQSGLLDEKLMAQKLEFEDEFRGRVEADAELKAKYGAAWSKLEEICAQRSRLEPRLLFHSPDYSPHLERAIAIVRAVDPDASEDERAAARRAVDRVSMDFHPLYQALFLDHLTRARDWLPANDPFIVGLGLGEREPEAVMAALVESRVGDDDYVSGLLEGGHAAVQAADDIALATARRLVPEIDANHELAAEIEPQEAVQSRLIGQAMFACYGDKISPDATMTLRFSDGVVAGYPYNGTLAPYRTTFWGLYGRSTEFGNRYPFNLPEPWISNRGSIDMNKAVNFVSTNDIIGGNSGSPVVDQDLHVVGLIFDGNIEQLPNKFLYRDEVQRSVSVHVEGMLEAMTKIYGADRIIRELQGE